MSENSRELRIKAAPPLSSKAFVTPNPEELSLKEGLVGRWIGIYWDGDAQYYFGKVTGYIESSGKYSVVYENDTDVYIEDLKRSIWKIFRGSDEDYKEHSQQQALEGNNDDKEEMIDPNKKRKAQTYSSMVLEAVINLNEKDGSSVTAIRKYLLANFDINKQHTASFNNLTLKALNKAVASTELVKIKHSFKLSPEERERRRQAELNFLKLARQKEQMANRPAGFSGPKGNFQGSKRISGGQRGFTPFTVDEDSLRHVLSDHNKYLRKELIQFYNRRDAFLLKRLPLLKPFLPPKHYFKKALKEKEQKRQEQLEKRRLKRKHSSEAESAPQGQVYWSEYKPSSTTADQAIPDAMNNVSSSESGIFVGNEIQVIPIETSLDPSLCAAENQIKNADVEQINPESTTTTAAEEECNANAEVKEEMVVDEEPDYFNADQLKSEEIVDAIDEKSDSESDIDDAADEGDVDESTLCYSTLEGVETIKIPSILTAELHEHQIVGISWMVHMFKNGMPMILGDQMGLGKTIQTIGFFAYLHDTLRKKGPFLVVVPLSVLSNWISEVERFCPTFRTVRFHGPKSERDRIKVEEMRDLSEFDIVVTTYEMLVSEIGYFRRRFVWTAVVIDEGHRLKNEKSQFSEKIRCVPCVSKVILTGTPLQNNLRELWALLYYLVPDVFTSPEKFDEGFDLLRGKIDNNVLRKARKMLSVFMLRRLKEHVAIKLPSRKEVTVLVNLTSEQVQLYKQLLCGLDASLIEVVMKEGVDAAIDKVTLEAGSAEGAAAASALAVAVATKPERQASESNDSDWRKLMNILLQLRKICNHTYLLPNVAPEPYEVTEGVVAGSGKLLMLDRMLPLLRADGHRVLLFSQFTSMLDILEDYCELRDYPYVRLDGETNRVKRRLDVRRFNADNSPLFIFLISTRAGGLGLNLASADTVILYDSDWNPQVDLQAMERAHRIGQKKPVRVFRLVCRGSVEERMINRAEKKLFLNAMVAEIDPDEQLNEGGNAGTDVNDVMNALGVGGASLSKGELASLIRFGANAVFEGETQAQEEQLNEHDLANLLERQGRDLPPVDAEVVEEETAEDIFEKAQKTLRERVNTLKEVDLRQLGGFVYNKKKPAKKSFLTENLVIEDDVKRDRKERIVMVSGKGTGYGGAVPILAENLETAAPVIVEKYTRGRQWSHREICTLCGMRVGADGYNKCAHCPFVFHQSCGESAGLFFKGSGMFICPHHRCVDCNRPTASAGGLLFRCMNCLTSYCEDCLPQDEIESVGRCRALEECNYHSQQAYYIKCTYCCKLEGLSPMGVLGDQKATPAKKAKAVDGDTKREGEEQDGEEQDEDEEEEDEEEVTAPLPSQLQRIVWKEVLPPPPPEPASAKKSKKRKSDVSKSEETETDATPSKKRQSEAAAVQKEKVEKKNIIEGKSD